MVLILLHGHWLSPSNLLHLEYPSQGLWHVLASNTCWPIRAKKRKKEGKRSRSEGARGVAGTGSLCKASSAPRARAAPAHSEAPSGRTVRLRRWKTQARISHQPVYTMMSNLHTRARKRIDIRPHLGWAYIHTLLLLSPLSTQGLCSAGREIHQSPAWIKCCWQQAWLLMSCPCYPPSSLLASVSS